MPLTYLKTAPGAPPQAAPDRVRAMLHRLRDGGTEVAPEARDGLAGVSARPSPAEGIEDQARSAIRATAKAPRALAG